MIMLKQKELKVIRLNGEVYYHNFNELDLTVNEMCDKQKLREKGIKEVIINNLGKWSIKGLNSSLNGLYEGLKEINLFSSLGSFSAVFNEYR